MIPKHAREGSGTFILVFKRRNFTTEEPASACAKCNCNTLRLMPLAVQNVAGVHGGP